uniref:Uncharacterized protein n=1 Tax=Lygus hesperus TaxID=30085 RepID=A0A146L396_LYGHE
MENENGEQKHEQKMGKKQSGVQSMQQQTRTHRCVEEHHECRNQSESVLEVVLAQDVVAVAEFSPTALHMLLRPVRHPHLHAQAQQYVVWLEHKQLYLCERTTGARAVWAHMLCGRTCCVDAQRTHGHGTWCYMSSNSYECVHSI